MGPLNQSEDALLETERILKKPLVSVLSGEDFVSHASAGPRQKPGKERPHRNQPSEAPSARIQNNIDLRATFHFDGSKVRSPEPPAAAKTNPSKVQEGFSVQPAILSPLLDNAQSELDAGIPDRVLHRSSRANQVRRRAAVRKPSGASMQKIRVRWIIVSALALVAAGAGLLASSILSHSHPIISLPNENSAQDALIAMLEPEPSVSTTDSLALPPLPTSLIERSYTVRRGDTLQTIARQFGLREDTIISANSLNSKNQLQVGKTLKIPNMNGIYHTVKRNESLSAISRAYGIEMVRIVDANNIASSTLRAGDRLFIPNAKLDSSVLRNFYGETFIWPVRGPISSPFGYRMNPFSGERTYHAAIDIVVNRGTSVKATREGRIADTGYNAVFGNYVIIRHADGYQSLYAHLDAILARKGTSVNQGEIIGRSGNTGQSTGPHLHFSIFHNGQAVDPRKYVK